MALIEGVGDEVTALFGLLSALLVLLLAWLSTRTVERADPAARPLAPEQPRGGEAAALLGEQGGQGQPSAGAASEGPGGASGDLRHRTGLSSPEQPSPPPGGLSPEAASPADHGIVLRLKFLNDTERLARVRPEDTVGALKRAHFPGQERLVRLIYQGQLLRDDAQPLAALHLAHHSVLHCHLPPPGAPPPAPPASAARPEAALQVGGLMVPLFALLLGALWLLQLHYRHVFTAAATSALAGLTLLFSLVAFAVYRR
ncbi:transmembrane and ubiquitin-like domain-containing protein 1 [Eublepharis macularius]|uniref:Transmembrane and ubiquitin-like domain-containing protein 1 n=1 Tax=Eublepharis macularius TaxID=481883 RepID=A0AA97K273_EUBMA|nr:transmembrane and ubiquitin-like domain-containing protein 1 [Eublepharis macularius]XP_054847628.1 transmembrane and ubiquitin-like domain-containing protein 1 [Eublepharis macularius]